MTDKEAIQYVISKVNNADEKGVELTEFDINKVETLISIINRQQAEIEVLNNNISAMVVTLRNSAKATRNEAIKEFADELRFRLSIGIWKHKNVLLDDCKWIIDNLVKEMVGK